MEQRQILIETHQKSKHCKGRSVTKGRSACTCRTCTCRTKKRTRCPKGTRKNPTTGKCDDPKNIKKVKTPKKIKKQELLVLFNDPVEAPKVEVPKVEAPKVEAPRSKRYQVDVTKSPKHQGRSAKGRSTKGRSTNH